MKYLKRILGLPFFLMLNILGIIFHLFKISRAFILYGGEAIAYDKKTTPKMIVDIYYQLEKEELAKQNNTILSAFPNNQKEEFFCFGASYGKKSAKCFMQCDQCKPVNI